MDNQAKWRKLGYKGGSEPGSGQPLKKIQEPSSHTNDSGGLRKVGEVRRTSDGDISSRPPIEKANAVSSVTSRMAEVNGIRKNLLSQEKRRRLSLMDEKDFHLTGK